MQGSHPEGTDVSALDHILGLHATIPADRGLFLEETWRLHPEICAFTSELFYESRLRSRPGLELQTIISKNAGSTAQGSDFCRSFMKEIKVQVRKRPTQSATLSRRFLALSRLGLTVMAPKRQLRLDDILIIAPYNAQVFELQERIPGARIGTVDKFQGQEAPIVIYSMTTSSHADAPRGWNFFTARTD